MNFKFSLKACKVRSENDRKRKIDRFMSELKEYVKSMSELDFSFLEQVEFITSVSDLCIFNGDNMEVSQLINLLYFRSKMTVFEIGDLYIDILVKNRNHRLVKEDVKKFIDRIESLDDYEQIMSEIIMHRLTK